MNRFLILLLAGAATPAIAQTAAPTLGGPVVAGVCLLSREAVFANAKVGVAANARLQQLAKDAQAEVTGEGAPLDAEVKALQTELAKLSPAQRQAREQALAPRLQAVQAKAQLRSREIDATRAKALGQISTEAQSVIAQVYKTRGCGLLIDRATVLGGNMANDITAGVVQGLDAKITTINFNREVLPSQASASRVPQ